MSADRGACVWIVGTQVLQGGPPGTPPVGHVGSQSPGMALSPIRSACMDIIGGSDWDQGSCRGRRVYRYATEPGGRLPGVRRSPWNHKSDVLRRTFERVDTEVKGSRRKTDLGTGCSGKFWVWLKELQTRTAFCLLSQWWGLEVTWGLQN